MKCEKCATETRHSGTFQTIVDWLPVWGDDGKIHSHDNNCLKRHYYCQGCGHHWIESLIRTCSVDGCDWKGNKTCFCHKGEKVEKWSDPHDYYETSFIKTVGTWPTR
jgi:hypothetical protein